MLKQIKCVKHPVEGGSVINQKGSSFDCTHLKCSLYYDKGGADVFQYGVVRPRGYYISVTPVVVGDVFESVVAFSGVAFPIVECGRANKKSEAEALRIFDERYQEVVRNYFPGSRVDFSKEG